MNKTIIGSREWCSLPELGIELIKAKIDSGAKTTALHADNLTKFSRDGEYWVKFSLHPLKSKPELLVECEAKLLEKRIIKSSNGTKEERFVIETQLVLGNSSYPIEVTLTNRKLMGFQMLLGRQAMNKRVLIDCEFRYLLGKPII
ncbi:MAG: ATP-dependent zinc protease [Flavobacterium sp.]|jgi:ribosomal protein S6--L-glutamate ligase